jgi:protein TonB
MSDVFTADEVARAVGVPLTAVRSLAGTGDLRRVPGTRFFASVEVVRAAPMLRAAAALASPESSPRSILSGTAEGAPGTGPNRLPLIGSSCVHALLFVLALVVKSGAPHAAAATVPTEPSRLVFLTLPGPGGGGGGSGAELHRRAARLEQRGNDKAISAPLVTPERRLTARQEESRVAPAATSQPIERAPEPLAARTVIAPVVLTAANNQDRAGITERRATDQGSQGSGVGGDAGTGPGAGNGEGLGSGIGGGAGGGTGGGPYRPGTGIQPPRLLREVKAEYTEDARRRGLSGDVVLEIVVKRDGSVGDVTLLRGLAPAMDQRAVAAVRQWQFAPARRLGEPVDVIVEVAVEFSLR